MRKLLIVVLNLAIILLIVFALGAVIWMSYFSEQEIIEEEECVDVNSVSSFSYSACYDAYSKTIFIETERASDNYNVNFIDVSFFDINYQNYKLTDVPGLDDVRAYKINAEKNPFNLSLKLNIVKDFSSPICEAPRVVQVEYCPVFLNDEGLNAVISPFENITLDDFVDVSNYSLGSDVFSFDLIGDDYAWDPKCHSKWECSEWEECIDDVQKRVCKDVNRCPVPTSTKKTVKYCNNTCIEDWSCEWSKCTGGVSVPRCTDLNRCGTSFDRPDKLGCKDLDSKCVPNIECGEWSDCNVDYDFVDLVGDNIANLGGVMSRVCTDRRNCVPTQEEVKNCSLSVDVYTRTFDLCGESFVGIYDQLNNNLIARISENSEENYYLDIYLDGGEDSVYCDYCSDGEKNGDEEGIDCGGSCEDCSTKYQIVSTEGNGNLFDWIKSLFS